MDPKKFRRMLDVIVNDCGDMSEEQTAELAANVLAAGSVNRTVVEVFLKHLDEEREEFVLQVEALTKDDDRHREMVSPPHWPRDE